jgi:hypothetical protein
LTRKQGFERGLGGGAGRPDQGHFHRGQPDLAAVVENDIATVEDACDPASGRQVEVARGRQPGLGRRSGR